MLRTVFKTYGVLIALVTSLLVNVYLGFQLYQTQTMLQLSEALCSGQALELEALQNTLVASSEVSDRDKEELCHLYVHVVGAVNSPGIYQLEGQARVFQALEAAGGPTTDAALEQINLAQLIQDGRQIYVPNNHEIASGDQSKTINQQAVWESAEYSHEADANVLFVNINTANQQELEQLSGIGEVKAKDIIAYRQANGHFLKVEEIMQVKGIGPATYDRIKAHILVR